MKGLLSTISRLRERTPRGDIAQGSQGHKDQSEYALLVVLGVLLVMIIATFILRH